MFKYAIDKMMAIIEKSTKDNLEFIRQAYEKENEKLSP